MAEYIIGDIHGCAETTKALVEQVLIPAKGDTLVFVGDYIDRGSNSKAVVDYMLQLMQNTEIKVVSLRGNHEQMLLDAMTNAESFETWMFNHGESTLRSYGLDPSQINAGNLSESLPQNHLKFLRSTTFYYESGDYLAVHAGFDFNHHDFKKNREAMLWTRQMVPDLTATQGKTIIHGHTPLSLQQIKSMINSNAPAINVDNGCKFKDMPGYGNLLAYDPHNKKIHLHPNVDE
jgi:serine/threonine protein phosphatase 1